MEKEKSNIDVVIMSVYKKEILNNKPWDFITIWSTYMFKVFMTTLK